MAHQAAETLQPPLSHRVPKSTSMRSLLTKASFNPFPTHYIIYPQANATIRSIIVIPQVYLLLQKDHLGCWRLGYVQRRSMQDIGREEQGSWPGELRTWQKEPRMILILWNFRHLIAFERGFFTMMEVSTSRTSSTIVSPTCVTLREPLLLSQWLRRGPPKNLAVWRHRKDPTGRDNPSGPTPVWETGGLKWPWLICCWK